MARLNPDEHNHDKNSPTHNSPPKPNISTPQKLPLNRPHHRIISESKIPTMIKRPLPIDNDKDEQATPSKSPKRSKVEIRTISSTSRIPITTASQTMMPLRSGRIRNVSDADVLSTNTQLNGRKTYLPRKQRMEQLRREETRSRRLHYFGDRELKDPESDSGSSLEADAEVDTNVQILRKSKKSLSWHEDTVTETQVYDRWMPHQWRKPESLRGYHELMTSAEKDRLSWVVDELEIKFSMFYRDVKKVLCGKSKKDEEVDGRVVDEIAGEIEVDQVDAEEIDSGGGNAAEIDLVEVEGEESTEVEVVEVEEEDDEAFEKAMAEELNEGNNEERETDKLAAGEVDAGEVEEQPIPETPPSSTHDNEDNVSAIEPINESPTSTTDTPNSQDDPSTMFQIITTSLTAITSHTNESSTSTTKTNALRTLQKIGLEIVSFAKGDNPAAGEIGKMFKRNPILVDAIDHAIACMNDAEWASLCQADEPMKVMESSLEEILAFCRGDVEGEMKVGKVGKGSRYRREVDMKG
ncbi:hypothetical protein EJ08DRAFT_352824 [Tothia fuscella]|uniref:Uncharacterized protein n=1 Tax=Tothia fuscella TaxID=1048955 RepID=A0A9P4TVG1_9PEZI|nr:hypothetical protein EJ08DRAFT_352824 [Tothia fuscella]